MNQNGSKQMIKVKPPKPGSVGSALLTTGIIAASVALVVLAFRVGMGVGGFLGGVNALLNPTTLKIVFWSGAVALAVVGGRMILKMLADTRGRAGSSARDRPFSEDEPFPEDALFPEEEE